MKSASDPAEVLLQLQNQANPHQAWGSREVLLVLLAVGLLAAVLFFWAAYIRKPKRRRASTNEPIAAPVLKTARGQKRRARKTKRRNPTLAETGGLPPRKQECVVPHSD